MNERTKKTGKLCVNKNFKFGVIREIIGDFTASGVIGLGPPDDNTISFVDALYENGAIGEKVVGINFENPLSTD